MSSRNVFHRSAWGNESATVLTCVLPPHPDSGARFLQRDLRDDAEFGVALLHFGRLQCADRLGARRHDDIARHSGRHRDADVDVVRRLGNAGLFGAGNFQSAQSALAGPDRRRRCRWRFPRAARRRNAPAWWTSSAPGRRQEQGPRLPQDWGVACLQLLGVRLAKIACRSAWGWRHPHGKGCGRTDPLRGWDSAAPARRSPAG